jgi:acyl dehydratase
MNAPARRTFDEIEIGEEYESPARTITESDIVFFAGVSGDFNVVHTDAELMKTSIFGERIAHGLLILSIQSGLLSRATRPFATIGLSTLKWKFKGPVKIGDTIRVRTKVTAKRESEHGEGGIVTVERSVVNQRNEVVQEGETDMVVERGKPA